MNKFELDALLKQVTEVLLTHLHLVHQDLAAQELSPNEIRLFCQPVDDESLRNNDFTNVTVINDELIWNVLKIARTRRRHGLGEIGEKRAKFRAIIQSGEESLYLAGDTIWWEEVRMTFDQYQPQRIVLNGGAASFVIGDPIVMDINDIITVCKYCPDATVYGFTWMLSIMG